MQNTKRPKAVDVTPLENYHLLIAFDNDEQRVFDCHCLMKGNFYGQLQDPNLFETVHIDGLSIAWDGGQDVCLDDLYDESIPLNDFLNRELQLINLMTAPFKVEVTKDSYEGGYAVSFPELSGCVACGDTLEQAVINSYDAKRAWLEDALSNDMPIPKPAGENKEYESITQAVFTPKPGYYGYYARMEDAKEESKHEIYERVLPTFVEESFKRGDNQGTVIDEIVNIFGYTKEKVTADIEAYIEKREKT